MTLSEAIEAVGRMISGYANGKAERAYIGTMAATLIEYPRAIAVECADPVRGVARGTRFLPTVADVVAWCEPRAAQMWRQVERDREVTEQLADREVTDDLAPLELRRLTVQRIADELAESGMRLSVGQPRDVIRDDLRPFRRYTDAELLALYPPRPQPEQQAAE